MPMALNTMNKSKSEFKYQIQRKCKNSRCFISTTQHILHNNTAMYQRQNNKRTEQLIAQQQTKNKNKINFLKNHLLCKLI